MLPTLLSAVGLVTDLVSGLILSIATMFVSLVYVGVIMMQERSEDKRKGPLDLSLKIKSRYEHGLRSRHEI